MTNRAVRGLLPTWQDVKEDLLEAAGVPHAGDGERDALGDVDELQARSTRWLIDRVNRARQNGDFERALKLVTNCVPEELVRDAGNASWGFAAFACLAVHRSRGARKAWEKLWLLGAGKTWKALGEFPERLRSMAKEVERINASQFFSPARFANADTREAEFARKRFNQLPGIMSLYAAGLEAHIGRVPKQFAESFPPPPRGHSPWVLRLSYVVKATTGKWHDREVAELLNAAAIALDEKAHFDALTVAQARSRFKKKLKS